MRGRFFSLLTDLKKYLLSSKISDDLRLCVCLCARAGVCWFVYVCVCLYFSLYRSFCLAVFRQYVILCLNVYQMHVSARRVSLTVSVSPPVPHFLPLSIALDLFVFLLVCVSQCFR